MKIEWKSGLSLDIADKWENDGNVWLNLDDDDHIEPWLYFPLTREQATALRDHLTELLGDKWDLYTQWFDELLEDKDEE